MPQHSVIGIVMATVSEAQPFIEKLSLECCIREPFELYRKDNIRLIISGIGKANAAMACTWLIFTEHPEIVFNLGAAGASDMTSRLGDVFQISEVVEPDRMIFEEYDRIPDQIQGFPTAVLATCDTPAKTPEDRKKISADARLTDMEGASVVQTCGKFKIPCYLFKFISDTPTDHRIGENIGKYRDAFCEVILPVLKKIIDFFPKSVFTPRNKFQG